MTKQKKIILGSLAAIGGILLFARAKKKRDLLDSGADDLKNSFLATADGGSSDLISDEDLQTVNIKNGNLSVEDWLSMKKS
jgi:hypothetical protein